MSEKAKTNAHGKPVTGIVSMGNGTMKVHTKHDQDTQIIVNLSEEVQVNGDLKWE